MFSNVTPNFILRDALPRRYNNGESDNFGFKAMHNRMHIHDLHATLLHLLGIDHERLTYRHAGRDYRLTDVHGHVANEILG